MIDPCAGEVWLSSDTESLEGWCWSADEPQARQVVDIFSGDELLVSLMAARLSEDLRARRVGDGRHGFTYRIPNPLPHPVFSVRHRRSGRIFGRLTTGSIPSHQRDQKVADLAEAVKALDKAVANCVKPAASSVLPCALRDLGWTLLAKGRRSRETLADQDLIKGIWEQATVEYSRILPFVREPKVSIILPGFVGLKDVGPVLGRLGPSLSTLHAEIVLTDCGKDPAMCLLPGVVDGISYVFATDADTLVGSAQAASEVARGRTWLFLDPREGLPTATGVAFCTDTSVESDGLVIRSNALTLLDLLMPLLPRPEPIAAMAKTVGLFACVPAMAFRILGGFDPLFSSVPALAAADMALKAQMAGVPCHVLLDQASAGGSRAQSVETSLLPEAGPALLAFRYRWCNLETHAASRSAVDGRNS